MIPKDKAIEILERFDNNKNHASLSIELLLLAVDKELQGFLDWDFINYWLDVKREIDLL